MARGWLGRLFTDESGKGLWELIVGILVIVVGVYLAFWVLGMVLRIAVMVVVVVVVIALFTRLVSAAKKAGGG